MLRASVQDRCSGSRRRAADHRGSRAHSTSYLRRERRYHRRCFTSALAAHPDVPLALLQPGHFCGAEGLSKADLQDIGKLLEAARSSRSIAPPAAAAASEASPSTVDGRSKKRKAASDNAGVGATAHGPLTAFVPLRCHGEVLQAPCCHSVNCSTDNACFLGAAL